MRDSTRDSLPDRASRRPRAPGPSPATGRGASTRSSRGGAPSGSIGTPISVTRDYVVSSPPAHDAAARVGRALSG